MKNYILISGSEHRPISGVEIRESIDKGVYVINDSKLGFYLEYVADSFNIPADTLNKKHDATLKRWAKAWKSSNVNMGILLTGLKGAGKTLWAKKFANEAFDGPILILNRPYTEDIDAFRTFLTNPLLNGSMILVDEFEKTFGQDEGKDDDVSPMLSMFDDGLNTRFLWMFISNSMKISEFMLNRPGRVRYIERFHGMGDEEIIETVEKLLNDKSLTQSVFDILAQFEDVSYDMLSKFVDEVNLFEGVAPEELIKNMNIANLSKIFLVTFKLELVVRNQSTEQVVYVLPIEQRQTSLHTTVYEETRQHSQAITIGLTTDKVISLLQRLSIEFPDLQLTTFNEARTLDDGSLYFGPSDISFINGKLKVGSTLTTEESIWLKSKTDEETGYIVTFKCSDFELVRTTRTKIEAKPL